MCVFRCETVTQSNVGKLNDYREEASVEGVDKWVLVYGPICFIVGFRLLFYIALVTKHSGSRK